jgi:glutamyl-tRNA synthetase
MANYEKIPGVRVRFAPSPTGYLHVGGARTALFNWLFARRHEGVFVLRVEDTDAARNTKEAVAAIYSGLRYLGIDWDEGPDVGGPHGPYLQSQRNAIYDQYLAKLEANGHLYEDNGAIRFRSPKKEIVVEDQVCGAISIDRSQEPDMTLRRPDGSYIFHFVNVVDDIDMRITHVIRGEDHLMNTPKHIELFEALGEKPPVYAHIPLFLNANGSKMSKRDEGASVQSYEDEAFLPDAVTNYLCLLGWSPKDDRVKLTRSEIMDLFDWDHLNRSASKFDYAKCLWLNSQYLAELSPEAFQAHALPWLQKNAATALSKAGDLLGPALQLMQPKIKHVPEIPHHLEMLCDDHAGLDEAGKTKVQGNAASKGILEALHAGLSDLEAWTEESLHATIPLIAANLGVKPGAMLFPLRFAVTGATTGVDLHPALVMLGKQTVLRRIAARSQTLFG